MDRVGRLDEIDAQTRHDDRLGQALLEAHRLILGGHHPEAATLLEANVSDELLLSSEAHSQLLLSAAFLIGRLDIMSRFLTRRFCPDVAISIATTPEAMHHFVLVFEKTVPGSIRLVFPTALARHADLEGQMVWLTRTMPLLALAAGSGLVPCGRAALNQWDAGYEAGLSYSAQGDEFFLIPDQVFLGTKGYARQKARIVEAPVPWPDRWPIAFWRGASTGQVTDGAGSWDSLQRVRLCEIAKQHPHLVDAGITSIVQWPQEVAREVAQRGLLKPPFPADRLQEYKFLIDVDGNSNAWSGFFERLMTGSPVLKIQSPMGYRQWYYQQLEPWHHYVPVRADMADLLPHLQWLLENDDEASRIGQNGQTLAFNLNFETEVERALLKIAAAFRAQSAVSVLSKMTKFGIPNRVLTNQGTFVCYDLQTSKIVHVAELRRVLPRPVLPLIIATVEGRLVLQTPDSGWISRIGDDGTATLQSYSNAAASAVEIIAASEVSTERSWFIRTNGRYLCAEPDGRILANRAAAAVWETFRTTGVGLGFRI